MGSDTQAKIIAVCVVSFALKVLQDRDSTLWFVLSQGDVRARQCAITVYVRPSAEFWRGMLLCNAIEAIKIGDALRDSALQATEPHSLEQSARDESPPTPREAEILRLFKQRIS